MLLTLSIICLMKYRELGARYEHLQLDVFPPSPSLEVFVKNALALPEHECW